MSRVEQAADHAVRATKERNSAEWKRAAFIGFQNYLVMGGGKITFAEWLKKMGLSDRLDEVREDPDEIRRQARENFEKVRKAFMTPA